MGRILDRALAGFANRFLAYGVRSPSVQLLGEARRLAALATLERHRPRALELAEAMDEHERGAAAAYGELVEEALAEMRADTLTRARTPIAGLAARVHHRFGGTDEEELLDDPNLDRALRVRMLEHLDAINTLVGNYGSFFHAMEPLLVPDGETRILDLAAGHGGFALEVARIAARRTLSIRITASDLKREYLDIGEAIAAREGLDVPFAVQDALDLSNLEPGAYDIVVCTQSIHHFPASLTARMFREAARVAGRGVVFIDGCRSISLGALIRTLSLVRYRDPGLAHDAWVSFRRFYSPEELGLVARLGPEADGVEATWMRPAHCLLRWRRDLRG